jgi:hypothetical protein
MTYSSGDALEYQYTNDNDNLSQLNLLPADDEDLSCYFGLWKNPSYPRRLGKRVVCDVRLAGVFPRFWVGRGWAVLPVRAQRATIVTEAWSVTRSPAKQESSTRKRYEPNAAEMPTPLGSNPVSPTPQVTLQSTLAVSFYSTSIRTTSAWAFPTHPDLFRPS